MEPITAIERIGCDPILCRVFLDTILGRSSHASDATLRCVISIFAMTKEILDVDIRQGDFHLFRGVANAQVFTVHLLNWFHSLVLALPFV
jgi:hypothetical protein